MKFDWAENWPVFVEAFGETVYIVAVALGVGGLIGLVLGLTLYTTRKGGLLENNVAFTLLNVLVNFI
ncbi:MAG: ABC transporter permease, partial [Georgenia sp.]